jgi:four helix bundle protein
MKQDSGSRIQDSGKVTNIKSYRDLEVWQKSMTLVKRVYKLTKTFPKDEMFGLTSQLKRAAVSVPSNIAEGKSRRTTNEYLRFLDIAYGSVAEVETQLLIACELEYVTDKKIKLLLDDYAEIGRMLNGLITSLEQRKTLPDARNPNPESLRSAQ